MESDQVELRNDLTVCTQDCACFAEILQNFSERQVLWSLCSVDFLAVTLKVLFKLHFLWRLNSRRMKNVNISAERTHP